MALGILDDDGDDGWREDAEELLEEEGRLTAWEVDFLESILDSGRRSLSPRQQEVLDKIIDKYR